MHLQGLTEDELCSWGEALGAVLCSGDVVLLEGPMGSGKTTFTRALARGLGILRTDRVRSPTFNICLFHEGPIPLWHVDLFRLADDEALEANGRGAVGAAAFEALGLESLADRLATSSRDAEGVLVLEWAELWACPVADHLQIRLCVTPAKTATQSLGFRDIAVRASGRRHVQRLSDWQRAAPWRSGGSWPSGGDPHA